MPSHDKPPTASARTPQTVDSTTDAPTASTSTSTTTSASASASSSATPSRTATPKPTPRETSSSTTSTQQLKKLLPKRTLSATNSPIASREASPVRPATKASTSNRPTGPGRPRKNSTQDTSPSRSSSTSANPPSAAATQRALSAATIPTLYPSVSEIIIKAPVPQNPSIQPELKDTPRWPVSPRLRSPPPIGKPPILSPRKIEDVPAINVLRTSQSMELSDGKQGTSDIETEDSLLVPPGMRTPARGASGTSSTLETVQEILPIKEEDYESSENGDTRSRKASVDQETVSKTAKPKSNAANESGSDSAGKGEIKMRSTSAAPVTGLRPSAPAVKPFGAGRGKASGEGSARTMTVETEVVSSVPQVPLGGRDPTGAGGAGSIRQKPSSETIRPKKEKRKTTRKTPSVTSGTGEQANSSRPRLHHQTSTRDFTYPASTARSPEWTNGQGSYTPPSDCSGANTPTRQSMHSARRPSLSISTMGNMLTRSRLASSKADIFEAKVASAVDEADSSDSEETFVYESNPPEPVERHKRYHSRTPSATSTASQLDQRNNPRSSIEAGHSVAMKKSMKFANSFTNNAGADSTTGDDDGSGTVRSHMGTGRGTTHHHHPHIGRWGRNGGNGHASLFDNESPFPNAAKSKISGAGPRHSSQPTSPRLSNSRTGAVGKRSPIGVGYDLDDGADDERTPLMSTVRSGRSVRGRRQNAASIRQLERQSSRNDRSCLSQFAGWLVLCVMVSMVISGALAFIFATTQPLVDFKVLALKNVLASEQDIIFDMKVQARNPNIVAVSIDQSNLFVFAKSKYAGTDSEWWAHPSMPLPVSTMRRGIARRQEDPDDPPMDDDPTTNPNLEIGHVYELDSPLNFEGSPFHHLRSISTGQIRVNHPGNKTVPSGSARWGRVLQHEFDLIVRGTLQYTLPLSARTRSISVEGRITVKPNAADHDPDAVHIIQDLSLGTSQ